MGESQPAANWLKTSAIFSALEIIFLFFWQVIISLRHLFTPQGGTEQSPALPD
jgi:hypothetical protein